MVWFQLFYHTLSKQSFEVILTWKPLQWNCSYSEFNVAKHPEIPVPGVLGISGVPGISGVLVVLGLLGLWTWSNFSTMPETFEKIHRKTPALDFSLQLYYKIESVASVVLSVFQKVSMQRFQNMSVRLLRIFNFFSGYEIESTKFSQMDRQHYWHKLILCWYKLTSVVKCDWEW